MQKIDAAAPEAQSADLVAGNIAHLRALFPELVTEGAKGASVNLDVLKALVGDATVTDAEEKYGLNWHGKRRARQLALTPSTGTLRPCPEESVDWDSTQNLMIEGDNLEVLKLLQKSYAGKVKLIYIDPPYNTGKDFVYPDNFQDGIQNYLALTGQTEGGVKVSTNTESSGRFHTDWLNMMYPRLKLARNLLRPDGVLFVSIDDQEVAHLRAVCDEVFGPENLVAEMVWEGANKNDAKQIGVCHEYVLVYAKNREAVPREWGLKKEGVDAVLKEAKRLRAAHGDDFDAASEALAGWYRAMKSSESFAHRRYRFIDARGVYKEENPTAPGGRKFQLLDPRNGNEIRLRDNRGWAFDQLEFNKLVAEDRIRFVTESSIMLKLYLHETDSMTPPSVFYQPARSASERLSKLMGTEVFDFPKDELVLQKFVEMAASSDDFDCYVVDFFAGSGTTGHAVMAQNARDGSKRKYILVQLPEQIDSANKEQASAAVYCDGLGRPRTIAELTKERLRRAGEKVKTENPAWVGDVGFRVFKLEPSNVQAWNSRPIDLGQSLLEHQEHLLAGRTEEDLLYELLLKLGLDLCVPIQRQTIAGKAVHAVGAGVLLACLDESLTATEVEKLAEGIVQWHQQLAPAGDTTCVFRDSAFADDVAKTNMAAILQQHGIQNVRSL
ncbi:site-specific DNA-methyltransferase [Variovorax sp. N23]|uniref:site-specific DNA-methyltransferase n=1 Tax=Variovorax sp. N23 TaxID=2980555 RepID=UPI0021C72FFE|nr:site-specific DNA-methyltransferase [Variovorax sp. N23]MCU4119736.1 site-specific DNA-methyltransferase [Variovorax sp. N23]